MMCKTSAILDLAESLAPGKFSVPRTLIKCVDAEKVHELLIEEVGGIVFTDGAGRDYSDNTDAKYYTLGNDNVAAITNLATKIGDLRITVYNRFVDRLDFFFVPYSDIVALGDQQGKKGWRIRARWNEKHDHYNKLEPYRCSDFITMARMPATR